MQAGWIGSETQHLRSIVGSRVGFRSSNQTTTYSLWCIEAQISRCNYK